MPKPKTVKYMANEAGLDIDEALLLFWEKGLDHLVGPDDRIPSSQLRRARDALGLPDIRHMRRVDYWCRILEVDRPGLTRILDKYNLKLQPNARNLPKNGIAALRKHSKVVVHPSIPAEMLTDSSDSPTLASSSAVFFKPLDWREIGRVANDIRFLERDDVIRIHHELVKEFRTSPDPISPPGVRDMSLLESAIYRPHTTLGKQRKYPTVEMAGSALLHAIIHDHPFYNGNKRTSFVAMAAFLYQNGFRLTCNQDEAFRFVLLTAKHKLVNGKYPDLVDREMYRIARWINQNSRAIERGELVIKWHELKKILRNFGVEIEYTSGGGSFLDLRRQDQSQSKSTRHRKRRRQQILFNQVNFTSDGRDVSRNTIIKIRKDLKLDEKNMVDSRDFYNNISEPADIIIHEYQRILYRLAKW